MIKNVAQSNPSYCMPCYSFPKNLLNEIEKMLNGYWWKSGGNTNKGVRWLSWDKMCMSKNKGVWDFKIYKVFFNLALLGKHIWHFLSNPGGG